MQLPGPCNIDLLNKEAERGIYLAGRKLTG